MKEGSAMNIKDLIPWGRGKREVAGRQEGADPTFALQSDINRAFENFWRSFELPMFGGSESGLAGTGIPRIEISETDDEVTVVAELPGMDEKDVEVSLAEGVLTIRGERRAEKEKRERGYVLQERSFGAVERVVPLPEGLDPNSAKAKFKNGLLTVTIPKTDEARAAVKRIPVQRG
jgi:HSP20 family protein